MEWVLSEHIPGCIKEKKETGHSQDGFTTGQSCLANTVLSYDKGKGEDAIFIVFSKAFKSPSHPILVSKMGHRGRDGKMSDGS